MGNLLKLLGDQKGATAVEYGLILALVVIAMLGALVMLADTTTGLWTDVSDSVVDATKD